MFSKKMIAAVVLSVMAADCVAAGNGSGSGTVDLQLNLIPSCSISSTGSSNFGVLDFGQVKPSWTSVITASTEALVSLVCSDGVSSVSVSFNGGLRGDRTLMPVACPDDSCVTVPYRIFRDAARTNEYVIDVPQNFAVPNTAVGEEVSLQIPLHGSISPGQAADFGSFSDTLTVQIDFN
jgi:spore coat protein U-like protein